MALDTVGTKNEIPSFMCPYVRVLSLQNNKTTGCPFHYTFLMENIRCFELSFGKLQKVSK
jgi:hypothetical protein